MMGKLYNITALILALVATGLFVADVNGIDTNNLYLLFLIQSGFMYVMGKLEEIERKIK
jgi:hypothetical protein